jgi:hypothetical protein
MTPAERLEIIRAKLSRQNQSAKPAKGMYLANNPDTKSAVRKRGKWTPRKGDAMGAPHIPNSDLRRLKKIAPWIAKHDEKPQQEWRPRFRQGPHELTTIAQLWKRLRR